MPRALIGAGLISAAIILSCSSVSAQIEPSPRFIQIPGPNPLLKPGPEGSWDDGMLEASDAFFDDGITFFYYHAVGDGQGYRLGVASASHPLGPFRKHGDAPILDSGLEFRCATGESDSPVKIDLFGSADGIRFDTVPYQTFELKCASGQRVQGTLAIDDSVRFARVQVANTNRNIELRELKVEASLGG